jgi:LPXTG-site transpeptidase (sortase) family protein
MQSKNSLKWLLPVVVFIVIIVAFVLFKQGYFSSSLRYGQVVIDHKLIEQIVVPEKQHAFGIPVHLKIPDINVDAEVESVGLTAKGAVDTPLSFTDVAWFNLGPRPGEEGSSVIDGHSGWKKGIQSVFDNLYKIKKGDKIYVTDEKGEIFTFIVTEFRTYSLKDDATDIFTSSDGKSHLNLITCVGNWNVGQKSPNDRFVVFADKE